MDQLSLRDRSSLDLAEFGPIGSITRRMESTRRSLTKIGVMLITVGVIGVLLPGPVGTPFLIAGGLVFWPKGFVRFELWVSRRFPRSHEIGLAQIERYLADLENRYPGSIHREPTIVNNDTI
jgi:hypothetical protein